jgi:putative ABC transport system permease protein
LVTQFLGESVLMALIALVLALSLLEVVMPAYGAFLGRPIAVNYVADWPVLAFIVGVAVAAGLLSGIYPALILSRFRPALALRAEAGGGARSPLRAVLVVLQFTVAIGLAIVAAAVFAQIEFARSQSLGFRRDNILVIDTYRMMTADARNSFIEELRRQPGILDVAVSGDVPFSGSEQVAQMRLPGHAEYLTMHRQVITPEYFHVYDMRLIAGRTLSDARGEDRIKNSFPPGNDGRNILINQAAAKRFGFSPAQAIDKGVLYGPSHVRIVGVFADAQIDGAREPARPTIYLNARADSNFVSLRIAPGQIPAVMAVLDRIWRRFAPNVAMDRHFLNESFDKLYLADQRQGAIFGVFVAVAISIACLGLFGLAAFSAGRRTREIGIRKTFGARTRDLVFLLLWQFSVPVLIANAIAWPVAWYYLNDWLRGFAYHIALSPLYFLAAGFATLLIAWATILGHALRVARANPILALRYE